jgi:signal transduction histidine kinase
MSSLAHVIELPVSPEPETRDALEHDIVLELATAEDLASGMKAVVERIRFHSCAARVEWWTTGEDGALELLAATGIARGRRDELLLGRRDLFVHHGGRLDPELESALTSLTPIVRRRAAEERLARTTARLARRNEALEDFAALVAHELKTPLHAALFADDPASLVEEALQLVETLLEVAHSEPDEKTYASVAEVLDEVVEELHADFEVTIDLDTPLPLPAGPLGVILRNLLANAGAAGARHAHVRAARSSHAWRLQVEDDGVGLANAGDYAKGSGLGLSLSRRIANRFGGALELAPGPSGGTRATLEFAEAPA